MVPPQDPEQHVTPPGTDASVPEANRPGHHPDIEQDKPVEQFAAKARELADEARAGADAQAGETAAGAVPGEPLVEPDARGTGEEDLAQPSAGNGHGVPGPRAVMAPAVAAWDAIRRQAPPQVAWDAVRQAQARQAQARGAWDAVRQAQPRARDAVRQAQASAADAVRQAQPRARDAVRQAQVSAADAVRQAQPRARDAVRQAQASAADAVRQAQPKAAWDAVRRKTPPLVVLPLVAVPPVAVLDALSQPELAWMEIDESKTGWLARITFIPFVGAWRYATAVRPRLEGAAEALHLHDG